MTTYDNSAPLEGWHVPTVTFCARLIGDDRCDCPSCQLDAAMPLDGRGENQNSPARY